MTTTAIPTADATIDLPAPDLVARAASLREVLRQHAADGDQGQVAAAAVERMEAEGLLRLTIPRRYDGFEATTRTLADVLVELARGDGSAAWSAMLINIGNWFTTTWPVQAQDEVWADNASAKMCVILNPMTTAERAEGGFRMSGKWAFASGSYVATHAMLGFLAPQPDGSLRHALAIVHPGDWGIERSWYPMGLKGSGSDTVVVNDVFIPEHRVQYFEDMVDGELLTELKDLEPATRAPFLPKGTIIFGAIQVGLGKAALDLALERMRTKGVTGTVYTESRNSPVHQLAAADAQTKIDLAELLMHRACRDIDESAAAGELLDEVIRARVRNDTGTIVTLVGDALDQLMKAAGSGSYLASSPLHRIYQDALTGGSHAHATPQVGKEVYGRLLLGADGGVTVHV
ncbi:indole oxygenase [Arthrobacter crystallopoietes BAB-32]|uniref:Indole oxygenase n=1 Tax=Arthrobacter crystallopoietes BAB-32 TaxID=1246476 RepID=N1V8C7_9MICC|nr:acyl-CoA dehydrogenase family protein [Arthrobacter crystallopoietes]EMY36249.1 indole oxygenase [Arthrobacter crystallopoietes BAB-32]